MIESRRGWIVTWRTRTSIRRGCTLYSAEMRMDREQERLGSEQESWGGEQESWDNELESCDSG